MALKFAILGLVALKPASGYDLKRTIDRSIHFIWNVTGPQIYNTLRQLREDGYVTSRAIRQAGKPEKHVHTITAKGMAALSAFANQQIGAAGVRDEVLLRIFFGNFAEPAIVMRELETYLRRVRHARAALEATEARVLAHPGPHHEARKFQLLSLRLKVAEYRAMEQELQQFCRANSTDRVGADARVKRPGRSKDAKSKPRLALVYPTG